MNQVQVRSEDLDAAASHLHSAWWRLIRKGLDSLRAW